MLRAPRLQSGDLVRLTSWAGRYAPARVEHARKVLEGWGLEVEVSKHALDELDYSTTADERRLTELNDALRDPAVRAVVVTEGGSGAQRIADRLDFEAARRDPKPVVGADHSTHLHLALWRECGLAGIHGTLTPAAQSSAALREVLMTTESITLHRNPDDISAQVSTEGRASGVLMGGTLSALTRSIGAGLPRLDGAILLIEDTRTVGLGVVDRSLTQFLRSGAVRGLRGVAVGRFTGFDDYIDSGWTLADVLKDRLTKFDVPVVGGLQIGHRPDSLAVPIGTAAAIDAAAGSLTVQSAVS